MMSRVTSSSSYGTNRSSRNTVNGRSARTHWAAARSASELAAQPASSSPDRSGVAFAIRSIVVVSSNAAGVPRIGMGAYGSSKAAATMLVRTAGLELAVDGIRVNVVAPGSTDTAMQRSLWSDRSHIEAQSLSGSRTASCNLP